MLTIIIALALLALLVPALAAGHSLAPWLPSHGDDVEMALELAGAKPGETFYDLGCGDGRTLAVAARRGLKAIGVEMSPVPYLAAKVRAGLARPKQQPQGSMEVRFGNLFKADISGADIIFVYGLPGPLEGPFAEKLEREAKSGVRVIACHIPIRAWAEKEVGYSAERKMPIYLYEVPRSGQFQAHV